MEEREAKTKRATAITGDERRKNDSCINTARPRRIYIYVSPPDVELSSCSMMDVYHVRQRPRHLLHHHHHHHLLFFFFFSHSHFLSLFLVIGLLVATETISVERIFLFSAKRRKLLTKRSPISRGERRRLVYRRRALSDQEVFLGMI